jgi:hypothetical protein
MAYILNDLTLGKMHNLATLTLHETVAGQNSVVHVVVPITPRVKLTTAQKKTMAKKLAKAALQEAATAL